MKKQNEILLTIHSRAIQTFEDFVEYEKIVYTDSSDINSHFSLVRNDIFTQMTDDDKAVIKTENGKWPESGADLKITNTLPHPCSISTVTKWLTKETIINNTNAQVKTDDVYAFEHDNIQNIYQDDGFFADGTVWKYAPQCNVVGFFKSNSFEDYSNSSNELRLTRNKMMSGTNKIGELKYEFINISKFIMSLNTNVGSSGGSFSMRLPYLVPERKKTDEWAYYQEKPNGEWGEPIIGVNEHYIINDKKYYKSNTVGDGYTVHDIDYFSYLMSSNDLLFISFEKLKMEDESMYLHTQDGQLPNDIANGIFDMIALIDEVKVTKNANGEAYVEVSGRDLMKLITDDGSWFFNQSCCSDPSSVFWNINEYRKSGDVNDLNDFINNNRSLYRMRRLGGEVDIFENPQHMTIEYILKAVISQLSNIEVVPGSIFNAWRDERTSFYDFYEEDESNK